MIPTELEDLPIGVDRGDYIPSPEWIEEVCCEIRARWRPGEHRRRRRGITHGYVIHGRNIDHRTPTYWTPPVRREPKGGLMLNFDYLKPPAIVQPVEAIAPEPVLQLVPNPRQCPWTEKKGNARTFAKRRAKDPDGKRRLKLKGQLRPILFAADPHCSVCRDPLQMISSRLPNFASVLLPDEVLCCQKCLPK